MFLGVSGTLLDVDIQKELTAEERELVAARLLDEQIDRFSGVKKDAYTAAHINPATWTRVTNGERVRPDRLVAIVKNLWPESRGRWDLVPARRQDGWPAVPDDVQTGPWTGEIDNAMADVDGRFIDLEGRLREIERRVFRLTDQNERGGDGDVDTNGSGDSAPTKTPASEPANQSDVEEAADDSDDDGAPGAEEPPSA